MARDEWFFRIKTATRALVKMIGTHEDAGLIAGVAKSQMHRWADASDPALITLSAAMKLEVECGMPCVTEVMAAQLDNHLVRSDGTAPPKCMVTAFGKLSDEFADVAARVGEAIEDGIISPNDHAAICDELNQLIQRANQMQGTSGRLRAVDEQRRAS